MHYDEANLNIVVAMDLFTPQTASTNRDIYSITRLNREVKGRLETSFGLLWIEAEISNFSKPASGHWYLTLKDDRAQVRCAMFKNRNNLVRFRPQNGESVLVRARLSLYEARGDYQLIIEHMEQAGVGDLQRRYDELKARLEQEGLFNPATKQHIPSHPQRIGVVTSTTGAAVRDVLSVLKRRFPLTPVVIYPTTVQGDKAHHEISAAISMANTRKEVDVLLLVRGGGSLEDLWSFNEETVARSIAASNIPIISGVGHETDFTIADFVADQRAPTPSVAAEMVTADQYEIMHLIDQYENRLARSVNALKQHAQARLSQWQLRLNQQSPAQKLARQNETLSHLTYRLSQQMRNDLLEKSHQLARLQQQLSSHHPEKQINTQKQEVAFLQSRLEKGMQRHIDQQQQRIALAGRSLNALSPLNTLDRGYNIAMKNNHAVTSAEQLQAGDSLTLKFHDGDITTEVKS